MNTATRQAYLASVEDQTRAADYWVGELGEFFMFDVGVTYVSGDASLTVKRCQEHIMSLLQERTNAPRTLVELAESVNEPAELKTQLEWLSLQNSSPELVSTQQRRHNAP